MHPTQPLTRLQRPTRWTMHPSMRVVQSLSRLPLHSSFASWLKRQLQTHITWCRGGALPSKEEAPPFPLFTRGQREAMLTVLCPLHNHDIMMESIMSSVDLDIILYEDLLCRLYEPTMAWARDEAVAEVLREPYVISRHSPPLAVVNSR